MQQLLYTSVHCCTANTRPHAFAKHPPSDPILRSAESYTCSDNDASYPKFIEQTDNAVSHPEFDPSPTNSWPNPDSFSGTNDDASYAELYLCADITFQYHQSCPYADNAVANDESYKSTNHVIPYLKSNPSANTSPFHVESNAIANISSYS